MVFPMQSEQHPPSPRAAPSAALSLSGADLQEFLGAVLDKGVPFRFMARGASMYPFIKDGDIITVEPLRSSRGGPVTPVMGDAVAFRSSATGQLVVHRVIARRVGLVTVRGDNCPVPDGDVRGDELLGRVSRVERGSRRVVLGWGPGRSAIAFLSRHDALIPLVAAVRLVVRPVVLRIRLRQRRPST